jgi:transcriptional regulator with XRE-family HTH domain
LETAFRIHPELRDYIRRESEEEKAMLEQSLLFEGCRDPLVVWKEENVLVDGHHRFEICERHGMPYTVKYQSFAGVEEAKAWMRKNQLARRNLDKAERDQWIKEMREDGWTQQSIADELQISRGRVAQIEKMLIANNPDQHSQNLNKDELLSLRLRAEEAEKRSESLKKEIDAKVKARVDAMREDYEKKLAAFKGAGVDREVVERLADERAAKKVAEAEARIKAAAEKEREMDEDFRLETEQLEADYRLKEKALEEKLESTMREMTAAAAAKLDIEELKKQKRHLEIELRGIRVELEAEKSDAEISRRVRKLMKSIEDATDVAAIVKNQVAASPTLCGLSSYEIAGYVAMFDLFIPAVEEARDILDGLLRGDAHGKGRGLHVVEGSGK